MTVRNQDRLTVYQGNGVATDFAFPFPVLDPTHVRVTLVDTGGAEQVQARGEDYSVEGIKTLTGFVRMLVPPASTQQLVIERIVPVTQDTDFGSRGAFYPETIERALDKLTMIAQQASDAADRSIKVPATDPSTVETTLPAAAARANRLLAFDAQGGVEAREFQGSLAPSLSVSRQEYVASAGQSVFAVPGRYTPGYVDVYKNGLKLRSSQFVASNGSSISLASVAASNDFVAIVAYGTGVLGAGTGGGGGGGGDGPIVVPPEEVDRIVATTIGDPALLALFVPLTLQDTNLGNQIGSLNGQITGLNGSITQLNTDLDTLQGQVDLLADLQGDGNNILTLITAEETSRISGDNALAAKIQKIGALSGDSLSFIIDLNTAKVSTTESLGQRLTTINSRLGSSDAAILSEASTRAGADSAMATQIARLGALNGTQSAFVLNLSTTYVGATESLAARLASITAADSANVAAVNSEAIARASADTALSGRLDVVEADSDVNAAAIASETQARADQYGAIASQVQSVSTSVGGQNATIAAQQVSINGLSAQYTLTVDSNGRVAGMQLASGGGQTSITFNADAFKVYNGASPVAPFSISGGVVRADNLVVGNAQIESMQVGKLIPGGDTGFTPKAWARFYGITGASAYFTRQYGFASVTRISQGKYQFTFANALPNRFYIVQITATQHNDVDSPLVCAPYDVQTTGFKVAMRNVFENYKDTMLGSLVVFGSNETITDPPPSYDYEDDPSPPLYGGLVP